ncbi:hypothetical protein [Hyphobacterium sp.]|uniref:hypothetical protein n=1 Tax=Hyphobacterium sp. TaxID=2004662 RepID=UPI003B51A1D3
MIRVSASLFALALALPVWAQETGVPAEDSETAPSGPDIPEVSGGLSLRGDNGDEVLIETGAIDEATEPAASGTGTPDTLPDAEEITPPAAGADTQEAVANDADISPEESQDAPAPIETDGPAASGTAIPDSVPDAEEITPPLTESDSAEAAIDGAETVPPETPEIPVLMETGETSETEEPAATGTSIPDTTPDADEVTPLATEADTPDDAEPPREERPETSAADDDGADSTETGVSTPDPAPADDETTPPAAGAGFAGEAAGDTEASQVETAESPTPIDADIPETDDPADAFEAATDTDADADIAGTQPETEPADPAGNDETGDAAAGEDHAATRTLSAPFLSSSEYAAIRPDSTGEAIRLVWQVETYSPEGERIGAADTRTLILAPDHVRYEHGGDIEIYDFAANRHLELDLANAALTNTAFEAEVRRRLDTYLGLSQAGRLEQIPLGPERSFERFWLEAAMGIRREPAELDVSFSEGDLSVERDDGTSLLTAQFDIPGDASGLDDATDSPAEADETETGASEMSTTDAIAAMATPIDLSSGESVVFDPSQAAAAITFDQSPATFAWPAGTPEQQAQAELFRRWMRHALPLHPDVLAVLRGAPDIPSGFAYFIVSPDSPDGRREVWTLQQSDTRAPGFRLEPDLAARAPLPEWLGTEILPVAADASAVERAPGDDSLLEAIADYREAGDLARAYLVAFHETSRNGPCPPPGQADRREVCAAANSIVAGGLGNPSFETVFGAIDEIGSEQEAAILEALAPYLEDTGYVGAAARTIVANELIVWAARDPEAPPADLDPFSLLTESIALDPYAGANYRYLGNALLTLRNPIAAWTVYDAGRSVPGAANHLTLVQVSVLEERLRALAPDFFLPR